MGENLTVTPNPVAVLNAPIGIDYEELDRLTCQYRCIPCNTVISGDINLEQHRQGRAHIKRLAGLSSSTSGTSRYYYTEEPTTTEKSPDNDDGVGAAMADEPANDSGKSKNSAMGLEDFESKCVLGQGAYGVVFKVYRDFDKQEYALKRVKRRCQGSLEEEKVKREVHALASLQHDHIVRYYTAWFGETGEEEINEPSTSSSSSSSTGSWLINSALSFDKPQPGSYLFIQMELCLKYTLDDCIYDKDRAKNKKLLPLLDYYDQIVDSIVYVHGHPKGFIHRDLKPSNIFFCEANSKDQGLCHWTVKVGDFGLVTESSSEGDDLKSNISANIQRTASRGTPLYKSPEQHGCTYGNKVDIYALGIILVEILCKFSTKSERIMELTKLRRAPPCRQTLAHLLPHDHFRYCDLLTSLLSHDPDGRPSAAQLLVELRKIYDPNLPSEDHQLASCPPILDPRNHQDTNRRYQRK